MKLLYAHMPPEPQGRYLPLHTHGCLEIVYFLEGDCRETLCGVAHNLGPNAIMVAAPGSPHDHYAITDTLAVAIGVDTSRFHALQGVWHDPYGQVGRLCKALVQEVRERRVAYEGVCLGLLEQILHLIERLKCERAISHRNKDQLVTEIIRTIHELEGDVTIAQLAERFNISKDYLRHLFVAHSQASPIQHIIQARLEKAKYLLASTDLAVREIGIQVGMQNLCYFSRLFKQAVGISPTQFRNQLSSRQV